MRKPRQPGEARHSGFKVWLGQHARSLLFSLGQLCRNPVGNLFSIAVIGVSLALPAGFYLTLDNAQRIVENWDGSIRIALYLRPELGDDKAEALRDELAGQPLIERVTLISRDEALAEYRQFSGFAGALDALEVNPLPSLLLLEPRLEAISSAEGEALLARLGGLPEVETAQYDRQWVQRLFGILKILQRAVAILSSLLSLAVLLIIGNTIRLSIINRRTEIEINKLFGATNAFIQRPFLYSGLLYGVAGSLLAWLLLVASTAILSGPVQDLAALYRSGFELEGLDPAEFGVLIGAGGGLGLLGSWLAVARHLRETEPG